jgi:hypothetical protein
VRACALLLSEHDHDSNLRGTQSAAEHDDEEGF